MTEFDLLKDIIKENTPIINIHVTIPWKEQCEHRSTVKEKNNTIICMDCGEEIISESRFEGEWNMYGNNDHRHSSDPNRCQIRKFNDRSILSDLKDKNIPDDIICKANELYNKVTKGGIKRKINRMSIIFACVYESYKMVNNPQDFEKLYKEFNLERKDASKGISMITFNIPKDFYEKDSYRNITAFEQAKHIMEKFDAKPHQIENIKDIYNRVKDKSHILNGSRTGSFSSGLVYYWIVKNNRTDISISYFAKMVGLSELTIKKIYKEIDKNI